MNDTNDIRRKKKAIDGIDGEGLKIEQSSSGFDPLISAFIPVTV
jgi:hypothetical protein